MDPVVRDALDRRRQEQLDRLEGRKPLVDSRMGALTFGSMAMIQPGCVIWAHTEGDLANVRIAHDGEARGGIVLNVVDVPDVDEQTGEIQQRRAFRCFNHYAAVGDHRAYSTLTEAQVDLEACEPTRIDRVRGLYRRMAAWIAKQRGTASPAEIDVAQDVGRLAAIIGQRR